MFLKPLWAKKSRIGPSNFYPAQELVILQLKVKDPFWKELLQPSYEQKDRDAICQVFRPVLGKHCSSFVWSNHLSLKTHHDTNLNIWTLVWISFGFNVNKSQFSKQTLWLGMVWWRYGLFQPWQLPTPLRIPILWELWSPSIRTMFLTNGSEHYAHVKQPGLLQWTWNPASK